MLATAELLRGRPAKMSSITTLPILGLTRDQSSQYQRAAAIPSPVFEAYLARPGTPSLAGLLALAICGNYDLGAKTLNRRLCPARHE